MKKNWRLLCRKLLIKWLEFRYRNQSENVCCCGGDLRFCKPSSCEATGRSLKEYVISSEVKRRLP